MGDWDKAITCLARAAPDVDLAEHQGRRIAQKLVYLLQEMGVDLGYSFSFTLAGVWSRGLMLDMHRALQGVNPDG